MGGYGGLDWMAVKMTVETLGCEWNDLLYRKIKFIENKYRELLADGS